MNKSFYICDEGLGCVDCPIIHKDEEPCSHMIEVAEVVRGRWEYWAGHLAKCPVCGYEYTDLLECNNYCGNCGARMEE